MNRAFFVLLAVAICFSWATPADAQFARASLTGTVTDPEGLILPGAVATVTNEGTGVSRTTVSSQSGRYIFNGLMPADYTLVITMDGFKTFRREGIELLVGQEVDLDVQLELGGIEETVTVTAETPLVELASKEVGTAVTDDDFTQLPTQNRSFVMFASLAPGVVPNPSTESTASDSLFINGQDDNNNSFNVDGANNDDDVIGARAGAQTRTAIEAIQEFQILTSQYDAEFGRTMGGVLNAVTKSGTNDFHGTGFFYYQDSGLNSKNFFTERNNLEQPDFNYKSIGGVIGGPIVRDKAHFFVSYERNTPNEGVARNFETRPELNFVTKEENLLRNWLWKVDWQAAKKHRFAARFLWEYSPQFNQIVGNTTTLEASREEDDTDMSFITSLDSIFSDEAFNVFRVSFTREDVAFANPGFNNGGQTFDVQRSLDVSQNRPSVLEGASTVAQSRINNSFQIDDTFSLYIPGKRGDHNIRTGFNVSRRTQASYGADTANGQFDFDTDRLWDVNDLSTYPTNFDIRVFGAADQKAPANNVLGLFFQDDWQPKEGLTLNLGVRYDYESIANDKNNIGPRIGFSWDPTGEGRTAVRGGWGRFYERFQLGWYSNLYRDSVELEYGFFLRVPDTGSNPQLFYDIAHANNITTLNGLRDHLANMLEGSSLAQLNTRPTVDNPDRKQPYADTFSVGVQHEIRPGLAVGADFVRTQNRDSILWVDLNPYSRAMGGRPNISILNGQQIALGSITSWVNAGEANYTGLQFSIQRRFRDSPIGRASGRFSYTWSRQEGTSMAGNDESARFQSRTESGYNFDTGQWLGEPLQLNLDNPQNTNRPSPWHRDHNFVWSWSWLIPGTSWRDNRGLSFSGVFRYMLGDHTTLQLYAYEDNNTFRQVAPAGTYSASQSSDITRDPIDYDGKVNGAQLPNFARLDLTFRYGIPILTNYQLMFLADFFNITNRVNFSNIGSTYVASSAFLNPSAALQPREFQFGVRFTF